MKKIFLILVPIFTMIGMINAQIIVGKKEVDKQKLDYRQFSKSTKGKDTLYIYKSDLVGQLPKSDVSNKQQTPKSAQLMNYGYSDLSHIPSNHAIDKSKDVGEIQLIQSDNQDGSLSYQVPIDIYRTGSTLDPNLQLTYNSGGANGVAGMGWQIGGLSAISAVGSTTYYDNYISAPAMSSSTAFMLDGLRLILKAQNNTTKIWEYETETGNIKIEAYIHVNGTNNIIKYFKVFYPNGQIGTYGYTGNTGSNLNYPLTNITDSRGNTVDYTYDLENNIYYIREIKYGGVIVGTNRPAIASICKISFTYESRTDIASVWIAGAEIKLHKRLKKIDTYYNNTLLQSYSCSYKMSAGTSLLSQLDCATSSKSLNPLLFYYGVNNQIVRFEKSSILLTSYFANAKVPDLILSKGKFDTYSSSDGLISYPKKDTYGLLATLKDFWGRPKAYQYGSTYHQDQNLLIYDDISYGMSIPIEMKAEKGFIQLIPMDINGDGIDELVKINSNIINSSTEALSFKVYDIVHYLGQGFAQQKSNFTANMGGVINWEGLLSPANRILLAGDFLGNGKQNILGISFCKNLKGDNISSWATLIEIENNRKSPTHDKVCFNFELEDYAFVLDFDGDGKADICHIGANGTNIYTFNTNGALTQIASFSGINRGSLNNRELTLGDINGDGKTDIILTPYKNRYYYEYTEYPCGMCSACRGGGGPIELIPYPLKSSSSTLQNTIETHNHNEIYVDGVSLPENHNVLNDSIAKQFYTFKPLIDIDRPISRCLNPIMYSNKVYYSDAKTWTVLYSTGSGFASRTMNVVTNEDNLKFALQDMNGDNIPDLVINKYGSISVYLTENGSFKSTSESQYCSVNSSSHFIVGNVMQSYKMSQLFSIYDAELTPITYTRDDKLQLMLTGSINSVGVVSKHNYSNIQSPYSYSYQKGPKCTYPYVNLNGNMFLLSQSEASVNNSTFYSITKNYEDGVIDLNRRAFLGFKKIISYDNINNDVSTSIFDIYNQGVLKSTETNTSLITNEYSISIASNKISKVYLTKSVLKDKLQDFTTTNTYLYDSYGNPTKSVTDYGNGIKTTSDKWYNNYTTTSSYKLGEMYQEVVTNERAGSKFETKNVITYSNFLPATKKVYINNNLSFEETYKYNAYGYVTESSSKNFSSPNWLTVKFALDATNRLIEKTNEIGLKETYSYNALGLIETIKDHANRVAKYEYDSWGNKVKSTTPVGVVESTSTVWDSSLSGSVYCTTNIIANTAVSKIYYDALGREIRKGDLRFDGNYLNVDKVYDNRGRVAKVSLPFKSGSPKYWSSYTYDSYNRPTSLTYASGKKDTYSYDKNKITSVVDGISMTKILDAVGKEMSVIDPMGTISYTYRPDGQLSQTTSPGNIVTTIEYDTYGRRIKLTDPSSGVKTTIYDASGNISQETDANGKVVKNIYDIYNRVTKIEYVGEQTISYVYNTDGSIKSETSTNGTSTQYTYDNHARLSEQKETVLDGKFLIKKTTYRSDGNIQSVAYSSNNGAIDTENYTYLNGHLIEIKLAGGTSVWKLSKESDLGQTTEVLSGGLTRTYGYDDYGLPKSRTVKKGSTTIQDFTYTFNPNTQNLTSRKDVSPNRNIQENFTYDNMNRLIGFSGKTITYNNIGNITDHSGVGKFEYSQAKPFMLTKVTPYGNEIPLRYQEIKYNSQMRPYSISENGYTASLYYRADGQRVKMHIKKNNVDELIRHYIGGQYEAESGKSGTKERLYIGGDAYSAATVLIKEGSGNWNIHYICRDYLGSITHITDASGNIKQELSYDAWGRLRNPVNQQLYADGSEPQLLLGRGYTGHEHLLMFGLINMNARLYDPVIGRFLSPDPYVQNPLLSQNFNRYAYGMNNPLKFVDKTGELFWLIPVGIGVIIGAYSGYKIAKAYGLTGWKMFGCVLGGAVIGGVSGLAGAGIATAMPGLVGSTLAGAAAGVIAGAGFAALAGNNLWDGAWKGAVTGAAAGITAAYIAGPWGAAAGGAVGSGGSALLNGENVLKGAIVGGITAFAIYHCVQYIQYRNSYLRKLGLTYKQFDRINTDYQLSMARKKEYGGVAYTDGTMRRANPDQRHSLAVATPYNPNKDVLLHYHTHWAKGDVTYWIDASHDIVPTAIGQANPAVYDEVVTTVGPSPQDRSDIAPRFQYSVAGAYVLDRMNVYQYNTISSYIANSYNFMKSNFLYLPFYY